MLRSKYRKRRNKKGGFLASNPPNESFMDKFVRGSGDLKELTKQGVEGVKTGVTKTTEGFNTFNRARKDAITKTGMDAGAFNPFKKKPDPFKRNPKKIIFGQSETINPFNISNMREANQRQMKYSNEKKRLDGVITGTYKGGKRKKRKTRKKRKMRKRKTRKQRKMKKRKTRRKRRR